MLEGGGMRSAYTAGVLDFLLDQNIEFPYIATASSGSLIGSSYIAKQRNRNYRILEALGNNSESISIKRWIRDKEIFNMDYLFETIPNELIPLDYDAFSKSKTQFMIGTTDIETGNPIFFDQYKSKEELLIIARASCSLPVLAKSVKYKGYELMDGGVSDPIPIKPLIDRGIRKNVVVLTRNRGYIKKGSKLNWLFKRIFKQKPELVTLLRDRHVKYNQTMQRLLELEKNNEVFIIQPEEPLQSGRLERNKDKLELLYQQGYQEAERKYDTLKEFINASPHMTHDVPL